MSKLTTTPKRGGIKVTLKGLTVHRLFSVVIVLSLPNHVLLYLFFVQAYGAPYDNVDPDYPFEAYI